MVKKVDQIVDAQIKSWGHRSWYDTPSGEKKKHYPVITVSREFGAKGAALAKKLGERIESFNVWDKELLDAISEELDSDRKLLETLDERRQRAVEDTVAGFLTNIQTNVNYLRSLIRTVKTIEEHGDSIIVGRGANYICQNKYSFHVRVVSPFRLRVIDYANKENLKKADARKFIEEKDAERAEFIRRNFYKDVNNASDYDLVINSSTYSLEEMVDIVLIAYEKKIGEKVATGQ